MRQGDEVARPWGAAWSETEGRSDAKPEAARPDAQINLEMRIWTFNGFIVISIFPIRIRLRIIKFDLILNY
ncbi:hypothetical protein [Moheibacter sediminis]|uniref:Uncharacterized protein n=1 Tax=Moheibacter sediminis TaxID=1434700 RepID=A0A1W2C8I1_9FLAO|nr:hypothetical protein [Moheibacter sediminis]SMC81294.1 hypothetical protein SAMN06296427_10958 [Moheibacter sediminis]